MSPADGAGAAAGARRRGVRVGHARLPRAARRARGGPGRLRPGARAARAGVDARARRADAGGVGDRGGAGARGAARRAAGGGRGRARVRGGAARRRHRQAVRPLPLLGQARAAGGRRAAARGRGVGDDGAAGVGRGRAPHAPARVPRVALAAGALTAWDVFLDPRMAREGYWTLAGRRALRGRAGVELPRLVGDGRRRVRGLVAARRRRRRTRGDDGALALYAWTWAGETFANAVLWRRPRVAAAGALAMGAFAVPALGRRWRA